MANLLQRFQAWVESILSRAGGKRLDVSHSLGLEISNKPGDTSSSDTSSQRETPPSSDTSSQPEPSSSCQAYRLTMLPEPTMPFKDDTASIISATVGIAAAEGGWMAPSKVVAVIEAVAYGVSEAPSAEAQVAANIIANCIANYATAVKGEPGLSIEAICEQARDAVPASSEMRRTGAFESVLESIRDALSQMETWEANNNLSPAIVYAGARVANSVAMLSESGGGLNAADIWSDAAERAHDRLRGTIINTGYSTPPLPDRAASSRAGGDSSSGELRNTDPGPRGPEALLQTAKLRAAISTLRKYTENAHVLVALNALNAVDAGGLSFLRQRGGIGQLESATRYYYTSSGGLASCSALMQANRLEAALYALWTNNTNMGDHEVAGGLAAVAAGVGLRLPPGDSEGS